MNKLAWKTQVFTNRFKRWNELVNSKAWLFFFFHPTSHELHFFSVTSGFTRLSMKTKYICRGLISLYVNFHNNPIKWSTNLHKKIRRWGEKEKEPKAWVACINKTSVTNFVYEANLKNKVKIFTAEIACLNGSTFRQIDPVYERNWLTSKLQRSNSLLEISKLAQTDPVFELNWKSSKFQISNSLLKKSDCLRFDSVYKQY